MGHSSACRLSTRLSKLWGTALHVDCLQEGGGVTVRYNPLFVIGMGYGKKRRKLKLPGIGTCDLSAMGGLKHALAKDIGTEGNCTS
jgi:hypothetical protein